MKKVSIIVPIYNKQKELRKCIQSLIEQSYQNIEIILVDDESTDSSYEICKKYARKDKRIHIIHKKNEGVEVARLKGIESSTGEYLAFCDSDDWMSKNAIEKLAKALEINDADVSFCNYYRVFGNGFFKKSTDKEIYQNKVITSSEFIKKYLSSFCGGGDFPVMLWGKLYKRELLNNLELTGLRYGEDLCWNMQILSKVKKIVSIKEKNYFYRWGGGNKFYQ